VSWPLKYQTRHFSSALSPPGRIVGARRRRPKRKIDGSASQTEVAEALVALLQGEREPYVSCTTFTLAQARVLGHSEKRALGDSIAQWAPEADLRKLAKKWDKNNDALADMTLSKLRSALLALLQERAEPAKNT
jgi:hypothetical protein